MKPCRKKSFRDKDTAIAALHNITNHQDGRAKPVRAYQCDACGRWHLTKATIDQPLETYYRPKLDWSTLLTNKLK